VKAGVSPRAVLRAFQRAVTRARISAFGFPNSTAETPGSIGLRFGSPLCPGGLRPVPPPTAAVPPTTSPHRGPPRTCLHGISPLMWVEVTRLKARAGSHGGLSGESDPSGSADNRRRDGDPLVRCEQAPRATAFSPGRRFGYPSGDSRQGRRHGHGPEPEERSGRPRTRAPHEEARSEETEPATRARSASKRDQGAGEVRGHPRRGVLVPGGRRRARP
jgi:hypothetical protein